jgi:hypothetical protein
MVTSTRACSCVLSASSFLGKRKVIPACDVRFFCTSGARRPDVATLCNVQQTLRALCVFSGRREHAGRTQEARTDSVRVSRDSQRAPTPCVLPALHARRTCVYEKDVASRCVLGAQFLRRRYRQSAFLHTYKNKYMKTTFLCYYFILMGTFVNFIVLLCTPHLNRAGVLIHKTVGTHNFPSNGRSSTFEMCQNVVLARASYIYIKNMAKTKYICRSKFTNKKIVSTRPHGANWTSIRGELDTYAGRVGHVHETNEKS